MNCEIIQRSWLRFWCVLPLISSIASLEALESLGKAEDNLLPICVPNDPTKCSQPIEMGQIATYSGQLLTTELAIDLGQRASFCETRMKLELVHASALAGIDLSLEKQLRANDKITWELEKKLLLERLEESKISPPWYTHPVFVATLTILAVGSVSFALCELAKQLSVVN